MRDRFVNIAIFRKALLIAFIVLFICIGCIIFYQYSQYLKFEKQLNSTYQRLSPVNSQKANTLLLEFGKAETAFRLYTLTFNTQAYQEYVKQIRIVKKIADSLAAIPMVQNPLQTSSVELQEKNKLSAEYAYLKKYMDELILYTKDTIPEVIPQPVIISQKVIPDKVLDKVVTEKTFTFQDTLVKEKKGFFKRIKNIFAPVADTTFITYKEKQKLSTEQVNAVEDKVDAVIQTANKSNEQQLNKARQQLLRIRKKERQLIAANYALLNSYKAGLEKIRNAELTAQRTAEKKDFNSFKENARIFGNQFIVALSLMLLMLFALIYYQDHANKAERRLKKEKTYASSIAAEKTAVLANISHEIRTPLNAVFGVIEMLKSGKEQKPDEALIQSAYYSIKAVTNTVNDILSLGKMEAGQDVPVYTQFSPATVFKETLETFQHLATLKGLSLVFENHIDPHIRIESHELRIKQIITNLLSNAVKFSREGTVTLRIWLEMAKGQHQLTLEMEDEGSGIDQETQQHLFRKYFSADAQTAVSGTGLGLYMVKLLVDQLAGTITFESEPGKGTTFFVNIPIHHVSKTRTAESTSKEPPTLPKNLDCLIVDDNPINILYLQHFLKSRIHDVKTAKDGYDALKKLAENKFHMVLTDLSMPGLNGVELLKEIRKTPAFSNLYVLAISADTSMIDRLNGVEQADEFDGLIMKPFKEAELIEAILKALKSNKRPINSQYI